MGIETYKGQRHALLFFFYPSIITLCVIIGIVDIENRCGVLFAHLISYLLIAIIFGKYFQAYCRKQLEQVGSKTVQVGYLTEEYSADKAGK